MIAHALKILEETTAGAVSQTYSFLQIATSVDLRNSEVVIAVKQLAVKQHFAAFN